MGEYADGALRQFARRGMKGKRTKRQRNYDEQAAANRAEPGSSLAKARMAAHAAFDPLWKSGEMSRSGAYRWLANQLRIRPDDCHIVYFDEDMCQKVVNVCNLRDFQKMVDQ